MGIATCPSHKTPLTAGGRCFWCDVLPEACGEFLAKYAAESGALSPPRVEEFVLQVNHVERIHLGLGSVIESFVKLEGGDGLDIGRFVHIESFAHVNGGGGATSLGDFVAISSGARVLSGSHLPESLSMSAAAPRHLQKTTRAITVIGPYAVVFTNAVVLPGLTLGEGAVLGAGSVAVKDIPAWEIWAGLPAKFIAKRKVAL